ncbi:MAG: flippase [Sulfurospirillum sp.]|nr:MAG: flippase [Sulfurospirillum sp.]
MHKEQTTFRRILDNVLALTMLQIINYLIPLLTFPYLVRVLGIESFGVFSFVLAVLNYGVVITDYGFDLSATKHISLNKEHPDKISEIFSSVITIKAVMALLFFLFLTLLTLSVDRFSQHATLYFYGFGLIIGQVLFPIWFFQGIEKMRYITVLNAISKVIFALAIFIFVTSPKDLELVFIFNTLGALIAGALAFRIAVKQFGVRFQIQPIEKYFFYLKDAWYIFTSRVAVQLYQSLNIIILGFFVSNTLVGYYAIAEKIVRATSTILSSVPRAIYPHMSKLYKTSPEIFHKRNLQISLGLLLITLPVTAFVWYFAPEILRLITNQTPPSELVTLLRIFAPLLVVAGYGNHFTNILVILNQTKLLNKIVITAGLLNLSLLFVVIRYFSVEGVAWLTLFIAGFVIILPKAYFIFFHLRKNRHEKTPI